MGRAMTVRGPLLVCACLLTTACPGRPKPAPAPDPTPVAAAEVATAAPSASAAPPAPSVPTLVAEAFAPGGGLPTEVYAVEGATMVVAGPRVGRITSAGPEGGDGGPAGEGVEWLKKTIPGGNMAFGPTRITGVYGRWPDGIGVVYQYDNGRANVPTYMPFTGIGLEHTAAPGSVGTVEGVARIGESVIMVSWYWGGFEYKTVRGTVVRKPQTRAQAGCKDGPEAADRTALDVDAVAATRAGTLIALGRHCSIPGPAAEVWDRAGKSRTVDLNRFWKGGRYHPRVLPGEGDDELWAMFDGWGKVLRFRNGDFEAVPDLGRPIQNLFVSTRGALHANDGRTLHRLDHDTWVPVAQLADTGGYDSIVLDENGTFWASRNGVRRFRPGPAVPVPATCPTPFVFLYRVSGKNDAKFTYPATRKALATFPEAAAIGLVELQDQGKRLGVTVTSMAEGEALIASLRRTMPDEEPRLLCFDLSTARDVRKIALDATP